jgi:hypothetical protein
VPEKQFPAQNVILADLLAFRVTSGNKEKKPLGRLATTSDKNNSNQLKGAGNQCEDSQGDGTACQAENL